jgi:hypothetical protein
MGGPRFETIPIVIETQYRIHSHILSMESEVFLFLSCVLGGGTPSVRPLTVVDIWPEGTEWRQNPPCF